jgi:signal peptidase II
MRAGGTGDYAGVKLSPRQLLFVVVGAVFALDRATKFAIERLVSLYDTYPVIPGFFQIVHTRNKGIAFGIFNDGAAESTSIILIVFSLVILGFIASLLWQSAGTIGKEHWTMRVGLALILAGALGNVFDRIVHGSVTDFLDFYWRGTHFPVFNVADSAITVGAALLLLNLWKPKRVLA